MMAKKPDLYKAPEDGVVLKYKISTLPLQDQVGHVRQWGTQVYRNGMASWDRMVEASGTSSKQLIGSIPLVDSIGEPQALVVGLSGVMGLLLARKRHYHLQYKCPHAITPWAENREGITRRILYPITAIGISGAAMWLTYSHNRRTLTEYCYKTWNDLTKHKP